MGGALAGEPWVYCVIYAHVNTLVKETRLIVTLVVEFANWWTIQFEQILMFRTRNLYTQANKVVLLLVVVCKQV